MKFAPIGQGPIGANLLLKDFGKEFEGNPFSKGFPSITGVSFL
jgi:hypothetical protein